VAAVISAGAVLIGAAPAGASQLFVARESGAQENPPTTSPGTGTCFVTLNDTETMFTVNETFSGLVAPSTASHIHGPAAPGTNASILFPFAGFPVGVTSGSFTGTFAITPAQVAQLKAGLYYCNVHSTAFPGGEIRGQLAAAAAPACTTTATGDVVGPLTVGSGSTLCVVNARVSGGIAVNAGGSLVVTTSKIAGGIVSNGAQYLSVCGSQLTRTASNPTQALVVSGSTGLVLVGDPAVGCAANMISGGVTLTADAGGVVVGANTVAGSVAVNNGTPGPTTVKANNIFGSLGCSGNNPAPTNAGQANTASAGKTGQCAGL
jgi:hypothetical protein